MAVTLVPKLGPPLKIHRFCLLFGKLLCRGEATGFDNLACPRETQWYPPSYSMENLRNPIFFYGEIGNFPTHRKIRWTFSTPKVYPGRPPCSHTSLRTAPYACPEQRSWAFCSGMSQPVPAIQLTPERCRSCR